ncbi:transposase [Bacillus sp. IT-79MI2]
MRKKFRKKIKKIQKIKGELTEYVEAEKKEHKIVVLRNKAIY